MPAAAVVQFDAASLTPHIAALRTFVEKYYMNHPTGYYSSEVTKKTLWEDLARGFPNDILAYGKGDDYSSYGDQLFEFLRLNGVVAKLAKNGQTKLLKRPRKVVVLKLQFNPATLVPVQNGEQLYMFRAPDGAVSFVTKEELDVMLYEGDEKKVGISKLMSQCDANLACSFVTEAITSDANVTKFGGYFGLPVADFDLPANAVQVSFAIFHPDGRLQGACATLNLPSKATRQARGNLLEIVCIGARGVGSLLLDVAECYARPNRCIGMYLNSLDVTVEEPGEQVLWIKDVPPGERADDLVQEFVWKCAPKWVLSERMEHHPHHKVVFYGEPRDQPTITKLVKEWAKVAEFLTIFGGTGGSMSTANMRATNAGDWYEKKGFYHLAVRKNREMLAQDAGMRDQSYFNDPGSDWQENLLRPIWSVSHLTSDTTPMYKPLR